MLPLRKQRSCMAPTTLAKFPRGVVRSATKVNRRNFTFKDGTVPTIKRANTPSTTEVKTIYLFINGDKNAKEEGEETEKDKQKESRSEQLKEAERTFLSTDRTSSPVISKNNENLRGSKTDNNKALRYLRWSASDVSRMSGKKTHRDTRISYISGPRPRSYRKSSQDFDLYTFYSKSNTYRILLDQEADKRKLSKKSAPGFSCTPELPKMFEAYTSATNSESRLKEWKAESYKNKIKHQENQAKDTYTHFATAPGATGVTSQTSTPDLHSPLNMSRRDSLLKARRRSSVFWVPPSYNELTDAERRRKREIRTFRWYGQFVKSLVGLRMDMQKLSISKTQQSAYSEFLYILGGASTHAGQEGVGDDSQHLLFDKSWFSRNRAWSRMPPWAQNVMQQRPDLRSPEDVQHLKQLLLNMRSFRESMTDEMRTKICQVVRYTRCDKGRVIFRQGYEGTDFYFIFSGSVFVQIDVYDEKKDHRYTTVENVLRSGEGFGEIALLGDGVRTATIICKEPTELCQIDKVTFLDICPALFNQQLEDKIDFARRFPIFKSWENDKLRQLCFLSQILDVPHDTVVEYDWSSSQYAYFVMKGRMSMLKEFDVTEIAEKTGQMTDRTQHDGAPGLGKKAKLNKHTQFANVGMLYEGDYTDLSVLSVTPRKDMPRITLVSEGVCLFRVAVRTFQRIAHRKSAEEYLKKVYKPKTFPTEAELCTHYLRDLSWSHFKHSIVNTHRLERTGKVIASVPATMKGSSGWARWPGYVVIPKVDKSPRSIQAVSDANIACLHHNKETHHHYRGSKEPNFDIIISDDEGNEDNEVESADDNDDDDVDEEEDDVEDKEEKKKGDKNEENEEQEKEEEEEVKEGKSQKPRLESPDPFDSEVFRIRLHSDRSMTLTPPATGSMAVWRKSLHGAPELDVFNHEVDKATLLP